MPFYRTPDGRSTVHFNFGRKKDTPLPCRAPRLPGDDPAIGKICGRLPVALCDAPAGQDVDGTPLTCSMPICGVHRAGDGRGHDYCKPRHEHLAPATLPLEETRR